MLEELLTLGRLLIGFGRRIRFRDFSSRHPEPGESKPPAAPKRCYGIALAPGSDVRPDGVPMTHRDRFIGHASPAERTGCNATWSLRPSLSAGGRPDGPVFDDPFPPNRRAIDRVGSPAFRRSHTSAISASVHVLDTAHLLMRHHNSRRRCCVRALRRHRLCAVSIGWSVSGIDQGWCW